MLDFVLGAVIVGLAIRGWWRGLLREAIALAVVVAGLVISFRLSTPVGRVVESLAGVSPETGRLVAGIGIFVVIAVGAGVVSAVLHKGIRFVPGLPTLNRAAGAGFSVIAAVAVATIALSVASVMSPPDAVARQIEGSVFAGYLTDPEQAPQKVMGVVSGDRVLEQLLSLRELTGARRVVGDGEVMTLEPASADDLENDEGAVEDLLEMINRERDRAGAAPLVVAEPLAELARAHAEDVYVSGRFGSESSDGRTFDDRLAATGLPVVTADQVMALAVTAESAQRALFESGPEWEALTAPDVRRVGIAAVRGPLGVVVVEVLAG